MLSECKWGRCNDHRSQFTNTIQLYVVCIVDVLPSTNNAIEPRALNRFASHISPDALFYVALCQFRFPMWLWFGHSDTSNTTTKESHFFHIPIYTHASALLWHHLTYHTRLVYNITNDNSSNECNNLLVGLWVWSGQTWIASGVPSLFSIGNMFVLICFFLFSFLCRKHNWLI